MPTIEINPNDTVKFVDANGDEQATYRYDTGNGRIVLEDSSDQPADQELGTATTNAIHNTDYNESTVTLSSASGTVDLDLSQGNVFRVEAVGNITITFSNVTTTPPGNSVVIYIVDSDGAGPYTLTWPSSVVWNGGNAVAEVTQNSNIEVGLLSDDGGTEWRGRGSGEDYA